jgi:hypothetical protein
MLDFVSYSKAKKETELSATVFPRIRGSFLSLSSGAEQSSGRE